MRGAKSNALFLRSANGNLACPCIALVTVSMVLDFILALAPTSISAFVRFKRHRADENSPRWCEEGIE
jgi:hypothetical protein